MAGIQKVNPTSESPTTTTDSRPVPDPTVLTTQQLMTAINNIRELFDVRMNAMDRAVDVLQSAAGKSPTIGEVYTTHEQRFASVEKLLDATADRFNSRHGDILSEVTHLKEFMNEKISGISIGLNGIESVAEQRFARIDSQFIERDKRTDQLSLADKTAVAAALQAAKEAVGAQNTSNSIAIAKSESSTVESIRQLQTLFNSAIAAVNDKLNDTRSRLDRGDGNTNGLSDARVEYREARIDNRGLVFGIFGAAIGIAALLVTVMSHFIK